MNPKKRVGLDFDDVLIDFNGSLAVFHNKNYGTSYTREHITEWDCSILWGCDKEEVLRRMREFVHSPDHTLISPVVGAVEAIKRLQKKCDLFIITARDESTDMETFELMNKHFPKSFEKVHFLHKNNIKTHEHKGAVCRELAIDIFVEDSLTNAQHTSDTGIKTLLFDAPWNQTEELPKNVTRVFSWDEIIKEIEG